jgi:hypothetical protein
MKYRFLCILMSMGFALPLCAQDSKIPPLPPGPLLKRAASYSAWTVTFQGQPEEGKEPLKTGTTGEGGAKEKEAVTMASTVIKTGSTILEQTVDAAGHRYQIWHSGGLRIVAGISAPMVSADYGGGDIFSINFTSSDFAGLGWLSPTTYAGITKCEGRDCIIFSGTVSPLDAKAQVDERAYIEQARALGQPAPDPLKVPATAYIDLESRLPLLVIFGKQKRIYQYGVPPQTPLALPPVLASAVKERQEQFNRLAAPAAKAF